MPTVAAAGGGETAQLSNRMPSVVFGPSVSSLEDYPTLDNELIGDDNGFLLSNRRPHWGNWPRYDANEVDAGQLCARTALVGFDLEISRQSSWSAPIREKTE